MNNNDTCLHVIPRPEPRKRPPLARMNKSQENLITMTQKKGKRRNTSNTSPPVTPLHSTPHKNSISLTLESEFNDKRRGSPGSGVYPDLSDSYKSERDESFGSILEKSDDQSSGDTTSSSFSISNQSSYEQISSNISFTPERRQRFVKKTRVNESWSDAEYSQSQQNNFGFLITIFMILAAIVIYYFASTATEEDFDKVDLKSKLSDLKNLFPSQDKDIWIHFGAGIADVQSGIHVPAIFILLAIHKETTTCLAKRVAELAQFVLNGNGDVILTPDKLENNVSRVFTLMENRMNKTKAVVIPDMLNIQSVAINAFHDAIDEYNPLVAEAVYLFTMNFGGHEQSESLTSIVEQQIRKRYSSDIKEDTLQALIVRFTAGTVLAIREENKIPCNK